MTGSIIDEARELRRWRPILRRLADARRERDPAKKFKAIVAVVESAMTALEIDPKRSVAFEVVALVGDLAGTDGRVRAIVERIIPSA